VRCGLGEQARSRIRQEDCRITKRTINQDVELTDRLECIDSPDILIHTLPAPVH
jgi:hypothetical protein